MGRFGQRFRRWRLWRIDFGGEIGGLILGREEGGGDGGRILYLLRI